MVQINIQKNQGLTSAIKTELNNQGCDTSKINGSIWSQIMNEVSNQNTQNLSEGKQAIFTGGTNLYGDSHKNFVVQEGIVELAQNVWNKIVSLVTGKSQVETPQTVENTPQPQPQPAPTNPKTDLQQKVNDAQNLLINNLSELNDKDLQDIGISTAKRDRIIGYLNNISYDNDPYGAAKSVNNGIVVSENGKFPSQADLIKVLVHEANHCDEDYLFKNPDMSDSNDTRHRDISGNPKNNSRVNTVEEEKMCERIALLTTAKLIDKGVLSEDNYAPYTPPEQFRAPDEDISKYKVTNYLKNQNQLESDLNGWIERSYPGVVENLSGDVTIRHMGQQNGIQLKSGDEIRFNDQTYTIGKDGVYLSAQGRTTTCQLTAFDSDGNPIGIANNIIFNNMEPTQDELRSIYSPNRDIVTENNGQYSLNLKNIPVTVYRDGNPILNGTM